MDMAKAPSSPVETRTVQVTPGDGVALRRKGQIDAAIAIYLDGWVPTINLRVDYLRPATGAYLDAHATVRRRGRTIGVVDIDVLDDEDRLCAVGRGTYSTIVG